MGVQRVDDNGGMNLYESFRDYYGGKPVDGDNITGWKDIEPVVIGTKLEKR